MRTRRDRSRRGSVMTVALLATFVLVGMGVAMLTVSTATQKDHEAAMHRANRRYLAQAGVSAALHELTTGGDGTMGSKSSPVKWAAGGFRTVVTDHGDGNFTIDSFGRVGSAARAVRAITRETTRSVFIHAMYAGNDSDDPDYVLELGGTGSGADEVEGDIFSGGSIAITDDAKVDGTLRATESITGASGKTGMKQDPPDLGAMHYETNNDVDVAAEFARSGTYASDALGGSAYQLPEENPAHIFRLNPSDRRTETSGTAKDDYFLEDPHESVSSSNVTDAANATTITLSGVGGEPGPSGNKKVYYIDGNLWIHNYQLYSFVFKHAESDGVQLTIVVKGNIYISDNILLRNREKDGLALIALRDDDVSDSGNIYFGDPTFGTLERMETFMYAENDFHDNALAQSGSTVVEVLGMMSAGNHVAIDRNGRSPRAKLVLEFDPRIRDGELELPGLPSDGTGSQRRTFQVLAEFEIPSDE